MVPTFQMSNRGTERFSNLPKVTARNCWSAPRALPLLHFTEIHTQKVCDSTKDTLHKAGEALESIHDFSIF